MNEIRSAECPKAEYWKYRQLLFIIVQGKSIHSFTSE